MTATIVASPDITPADAADWEDAPRRPTDVNAAPVLAIDGFEGPLDWLLELARGQKIDLRQLSILALVEAFAEALETALASHTLGGDRLTAWADWLVMAATLTLLRSRLLRPGDSPEAGAARDEAEALRRRLVNRSRIAAAADWLNERPQLGRDVFCRSPADRRIDRAGRVGDVTALFRACLVVLRLPDDAETAYRLPPPKVWSMAQAVARIQAMLPTLGADGAGLPVFLPAVPADAPDRDARCRAAVAGTFAAALEMAREGALRLEQTDADPMVHNVSHQEQSDQAL